MGTLYVVATPVGNLEDITVRAIKTLLSCEVIACEDTRRTGVLIKILKEKYSTSMTNDQGTSNKKYISVRDWNEENTVNLILGVLANTDVALVSDAGTPLISDPGYRVVRAAREVGIKVVPIPGPSAVTAALSAAGLPTDKFVFLGFNWKKNLQLGMTNVIYESPVRADKTVGELVEKYPEAEIVIARELTKVHEEIIRYQKDMKLGSKGEVTILVYLPAR